MYDLNPNVAEAQAALTQKPLLATSAERFLILDEIKSSCKELPQPKRFARFLSVLLSRVSTPIEPYDLIVGRCVDRLLTQEEEKRFQAFLKHPDHPKRQVLFSSGHCSYEWDEIVEYGLPGLRARACASLAERTDADQRAFLESVIEIYDALRDFMLRYADAALKKGMERVAKNMKKAATERPDDFYSALQLLWIVTLVDCAYITPNPTLTLGRLDQILYPLYRADLEAGRMTREEAAAYITDYYCKHNLIMGRGEHQVGDATNSTTFDRICCFDAPQYLLLAGTDEKGKSAVNDLTLLFAECIVPAFKNPVAVVRYFKGMDKAYPDLWRVLTGKSLQSASLMYYNDGNVLKTYQRLGIPENDARQYIHFGCNWPGLGVKAGWMLIGPKSDKYHAYNSSEEAKELRIPYMRMNAEHGWPEDLMIVLRELAGREAQGITIEDVYAGFFGRMADFIDRKLAHLSHELEVRRRRPAAVLTFGDCFYADSVRDAACFSAGAKYHFEFQSFYMFGSVADCIITVDQLVFIEKRLTLKDLLIATDANFKGYPELLALCRHVPKYGSDTAHSNAHVKRLAETAARMIIEKSRPYLERQGLFLEPCLQSDTWHLKMGESFGATPDGRLAHTPFSQNARPANGSCINGITAMFNAMLSIPADGFLSGALNLDIDPKDYAGEGGHALFAALLATYFSGGGLHAQVTAADVNALIDAQQHPNDHRDLRVRVTGYSGVFVDICRRLQDDIIERLK
ncbi:MAG: hypothetical protein IJX39_06130 [Clostridia bacterium]|nr:hypothetical protein [Clostridia bacterium]